MIGLFIGFVIPYLITAAVFYHVIDISTDSKENTIYFRLRKMVSECFRYKLVLYSALGFGFLFYAFELFFCFIF